MRYSVSDTAEYGDYTRGPRVVTQQTREDMKKILAEVQSGQFAREWMDENKTRPQEVPRHARSRRALAARNGRRGAARDDDVPEEEERKPAFRRIAGSGAK